MIQVLNKQLPPGYIAEPRVHVGAMIEIDIGSFESDEPRPNIGTVDDSGGVATAVWAPVTASAYSFALKFQHFREEVGAVAATQHLAADAVLRGMTLQ
jgi:hypothetical protein